jgi:hypothetical protein
VLFPSTISDDEKEKRILVVSGDISDPDDMLRIQEVIVKGESYNIAPTAKSNVAVVTESEVPCPSFYTLQPGTE